MSETESALSDLALERATLVRHLHAALMGELEALNRGLEEVHRELLAELGGAGFEVKLSETPGPKLHLWMSERSGKKGAKRAAAYVLVSYDAPAEVGVSARVCTRLVTSAREQRVSWKPLLSRCAEKARAAVDSLADADHALGSNDVLGVIVPIPSRQKGQAELERRFREQWKALPAIVRHYAEVNAEARKR